MKRTVCKFKKIGRTENIFFKNKIICAKAVFERHGGKSAERTLTAFMAAAAIFLSFTAFPTCADTLPQEYKTQALMQESQQKSQVQLQKYEKQQESQVHLQKQENQQNDMIHSQEQNNPQISQTSIQKKEEHQDGQKADSFKQQKVLAIQPQVQEYDDKDTHNETDIGTDLYGECYDAAGAEGLKQSLDDTTLSDLSDLGIDPSNPYSGGLSAKNVFEKLFEKIKNAFISPFSSLSGVLTALIICSAFGTLSKNRLSDTADFTAAVCISGIAVVPFCSCIASAVNTISLCCTFIISFVPIYCGILLCMGSAAFSSAVSAAVFGLAQVVSTLAGTVITPFSGMYLALSVSCAFSPEMRLRGLTSAVKKAIFWTLGIAMTVFSAVLGITGSINSAADTVSVKTARFFLSNSIPIVGGAITDAVGTLAGSISVLRSGVGAFGICALLLLILPALLQMLLWKASLSVMSAAAELFGQKRCGELLKGLGDGAGLLLSIIVSAGVLFLVTFAILFLGGKQLWEA